MSDTNPAQAAGGDEALSFQDGADAILDLLPDPETDLNGEDQGQQEEAAEPEVEGEQPETEGEGAAEEEGEEDQDGPQGYESGKFASDTANVRLKDGSVISVQDLKRGYLSQASFTRGTQENARERETLASQKAEIEQFARSLHEQREFILQVSQQFLPEQPDSKLLDPNSSSYDPFRYMALKDDYEKKLGVIGKLHGDMQATQARVTQEQQQQSKTVREREAKLLGEAMPELKKPEVYRKFWAESVETMAEYGFSQEEMNNSPDHRLYRMYRDLAAYRRARKSLPTIKQAVQSKPVLTGKKRMDPKDKSSREHVAKSEQLRRTGTFEAGVNALMDLDL